MPRFLLPLVLSVLLFSCNKEDYRTGDGAYSYYSAEMALLSLKDSLVRTAELDDGRTLVFAQPQQASVLRKNFKQSVVGDSCRLMLHFNKGAETSSTVQATKLNGADVVLMPELLLADTLKKELKADPMNVLSSWKAGSGKFYNFNFSIKSGVMDDAKAQSIGIVCDSISADGAVCLHLVHDQRNVPEYYSVDLFLSISRKQIDDVFSHYGIQPPSTPKLKLSVNTYQGKKRIEL